MNARISVASESIVRSATLLDEAWLTKGGVALDGTWYGTPCAATAWGKANCPLLPRMIRDEQRGVEIPHRLGEVLGASLTCDQMDSEVWEYCDIDVLSPVGRALLRDFLYSLRMPIEKVAIPAGIPLVWLDALPVTNRTRSAIWKGFHVAGRDDYLTLPLLAGKFLGFRSIGITTLIDLMCVMESAEREDLSEVDTVNLNATEMPPIPTALETSVNLAMPELIQRITPLSDYLNTFAAWARAETDVSTVGEAVAEAMQRYPVVKEWEPIGSASLEDLANLPTHPYEILDDWVGQLSARDSEIFWGRVSGSRPKCTLQELGDLLGVSRERVRQLEVHLRKMLDVFLTQKKSRPLHWRAETMRYVLGIAVPMNAAEPILRAPRGCNDYRSILLELAGPYDQDSGWLVRKSARSTDPTPQILSQVDEFGRIDRELASKQLQAWGLEVALHEGWLTRHGTIRLFNGQLVHWGRSIGDRIAFALSDIGHPTTVEEVMHHLEENCSQRTVYNAMSGDPRLDKVSLRHWGLASWGLPVYSGVAYSMRNLLEENGNSMSVYDMVRCIQRDFNVPETTVRAYCEAPMFVVENGFIRNRTEEDEPYQSNPTLIRRTQGIFCLGAGRVSRLFSVNSNILRGSGSTLTHAAGAILDVRVNDNLMFTNEQGDTVRVTFPESSVSGPSIGSCRAIAERLLAQTGDLLTLILDRSDMSVAAYMTDLADYEPSWELVSRLTGVAEPKSLDDLASSLRCNRGEVHSILRSRRDDEVLKALPEQNISATLNEALTALGGQMQQT